MLRLFVRVPPSDDGNCATQFAIGVGLFIAGVVTIAMVVIPLATVNQSVANLTSGALKCTSETEQVEASGYAENSIPENYLEIYQRVGEEKGIPWNVLAGIGQVESHHGRWDGPGITEGHNDWGAAGPMQFGALDGSAAGNSWVENRSCLSRTVQRKATARTVTATAS